MLSDIVWEPSAEYLNTRVVDFMKLHGMTDYHELIARSVADPEWFWTTFCQFAGVRWAQNYTHLMDQSAGIAWTKWFVDGETNIAYNCLDYHLLDGHHNGIRTSVGANHQAIIWENEAGERRKLTYGELNKMSGQVARLLENLGLKPGDPVGIYMPMVPEMAAIVFGCLKFGSPFVPVFSGYGAKPLAVRLADCGVKVLFTADGGGRRGLLIDIKKDVDEALQSTPDLKRVVVLKYKANAINFDSKRDLWFDQSVLSLEPLPTRFDLPSEHPSMYLYTSGTTGKPKGCIHTHAGAMAQIVKELGINFDVQRSDKFFWLTDIGWMMGPWMLIGVTFWGGTVVLYEGAPNYPNPDRLWQLVDDLGVTTLGVSPTAIRLLKAQGDHWLARHNFSSLRLLGSTGEPWDQESYMWFFERVGGRRCPIINISGGTELVGCLLMPLPVMPLKACSLGAPGLGMDVDVFDQDGHSVQESIGHLVCKKPAPSMTRGFLGEAQRYLDAYFSKFPDVWYHGDWAKQDADGEWFLFGRSDDTIKVAGKRVGPAEVESVLMQYPEVSEAAAIGVPHEIKGEALVCFVVTKPNIKATDDLARHLQEHIGKELGHVLKPDRIQFVAALPKTRSGKIVRGAIRRVYLGEPDVDDSAVENTEALTAILEQRFNK